MNATVHFALSTEGQRDALRRGLPAQVHQTVVTNIDAKDLRIATILNDGTIHISAYSACDPSMEAPCGRLPYSLLIDELPASPRQLLDAIHHEIEVKQCLLQEPIFEGIFMMAESKITARARYAPVVAAITAPYRKIVQMLDQAFGKRRARASTVNNEWDGTSKNGVGDSL